MFYVKYELEISVVNKYQVLSQKDDDVDGSIETNVYKTDWNSENKNKPRPNIVTMKFTYLQTFRNNKYITH